MSSETFLALSATLVWVPWVSVTGAWTRVVLPHTRPGLDGAPGHTNFVNHVQPTLTGAGCAGVSGKPGLVV